MELFSPPELLLAALIVAVVLLEAFFTAPGSRVTASMGYASLFGSLAILAVALSSWPESLTTEFSSYCTVLILSFACLTILMSLSRHRGADSDAPGKAFYPLLLCSVLGMMVMVRAQDLLLLFVSLELAVLSLQALIICGKSSRIAVEAGLRLAMTGAVASAFFLLGLVLVYGATGTTDLAELVAAYHGTDVTVSRLTLAGMALLAVAVGARIGVVPLHMWFADVFHGAPAPVSALLASAGTAAAVAVAMRLCAVGFDLVEEYAVVLTWVAAALTMTVGNLLAMNQRRLKRLLGYASLAHIGYALAGLCAMGSGGGGGVAFYLSFYGMAVCGCCAVLLALCRERETELEIDDCLGLAHRHPLLAGTLLVLLLALVGVPPTMGFTARYWVLSSVLDAGFGGLALVILINSLLTAYVYARLIVRLLSPPGAGNSVAVHVDPPLAAALVLMLLFSVGGGVWSQPLVSAARQAGLIGW